MILTDRQIREAHENGNIVIEPFDDAQVQGATYDLRVGEYGATTTTKRKVNIKNDGAITFSPGDFGIVTVLEELKLGNQYVGRFGLRSKYARKGLIATTGPQIDPGFHGRLFIGITNLTPRSVSLPYKDDFISVEFHKLEEPASKPYSGPYQDKLDLRPEDLEAVLESEGMALSEVMMLLRSLSANVSTMAQTLTGLTSEFKAFKWTVPIIVTVGIAAIGIIVAIK